MTTSPAHVDSIILWTEEEARFLRAVLSWETLRTRDSQLGLSLENSVRRKPEVNRRPPVGEFRVLVIGAKWTGKTSILTRFCQGRLPGEGEPHDPFYENGCRHIVEIEGQNYMIDALELPSKHLWRDDVVQQAIHITEAAILVYDITNPDSLKLAQGLHDLIRDTVGTREYGLTLLGNKSDVDDEQRRVPWSEGSKAAANFSIKCSFVEVSAKTGDNVNYIFPQVGREILKLKWLNQQRKDHAENMMRLRQSAPKPSQKQRKGVWWRISHPFSRRPMARA